MPNFRGLKIEIADKYKDPLKEWGVQQLRGAKQVSCYIEAKSGKQFQVAMKVRIPFVDPDGPAAHQIGTRHQPDPENNPGHFTIDEEEFVGYDSDGEGAGSRYTRDGSGRFVNEHQRKNATRSASVRDRNRDSYRPSYDDRRRSDGNLRKGHGKVPPPPYHLLASLFIDGRSKAERKAIIYLDPEHDEFTWPCRIQERLVDGRNGQIKSFGWVFQDVGVGRIENLLDQMLISGTHHANEKVYVRDEDVLINAMNTTALDPENELKQEVAKRGKIEIEIRRIKVGERFMNYNYKPKHREGEDEDLEMGDADKNITHTAGLKQTGSEKSRQKRSVTFADYKEGEGPYAVFTFFYRSEETLRKFGFPGFPVARSRTTKATINTALSNLTPLSIKENKLRLVKAAESGKKEPTFEEKIEKGEKRTVSTPEVKFEGTYRSTKKHGRKESRSRRSISKESLTKIGGESSDSDTPKRRTSVSQTKRSVSASQATSNPFAGYSDASPKLTSKTPDLDNSGHKAASSAFASDSNSSPKVPNTDKSTSKTTAKTHESGNSTSVSKQTTKSAELNPISTPASTKASPSKPKSTTTIKVPNADSYRDPALSSNDADDEGVNDEGISSLDTNTKSRHRPSSALIYSLDAAEEGEIVEQEPKQQNHQVEELEAGLGDLSIRKRKGDGEEVRMSSKAEIAGRKKAKARGVNWLASG